MVHRAGHARVHSAPSPLVSGAAGHRAARAALRRGPIHLPAGEPRRRGHGAHLRRTPRAQHDARRGQEGAGGRPGPLAHGPQSG